MSVNKMKRICSGVAGRLALFAAILFVCTGQVAQANFTYFEGFETFIDNTPPAGWAIAYNQPGGNDNPQWKQGFTYGPGADALGFDAYQGTPRSYAATSWAAGYDSDTTTWSFINTWLITPVFTMNNGDTISFFTRQTDYYNGQTPSYPNSLDVRLSTNGASTDIGTGASGVGDFTTSLVSINLALSDTGYPETWTQYSATITGLSGPTQGRIGFQYALDPSTANVASYIGVDSFSYTAVPEPSSFVLIGMGLAGVAYRRTRVRARA